MKYLFVHDAFPGQFVHLLRHLHRVPGVEIVAASRKGSTLDLPIRQVVYEVPEALGPQVENTGPAMEAAALGYDLSEKIKPLISEGWAPDYIVTHASRGASYFLRDLFPDARITAFLEWYYRDPDVTSAGNNSLAFCRQCAANNARNSVIARDFDLADIAYAPTGFQREQFPARWQAQIEVCHEGIDTVLYSPDELVSVNIGDKTFSRDMEIITYAARGMEKSRGFPAFMKAIALLQKQRPETHVMIAAADRVCYDSGPRDKGLKSWADKEVAYDPERTHFVGLLPERQFVKMLQLSSVHAYLSIPFVLSWSCLNAMSVGVPVVASNNASVREVVAHNKSGVLVNPEDPEAIAAEMMALLDDKQRRTTLGQQARSTILEQYDLNACLARQLELITGKTGT